MRTVAKLAAGLNWHRFHQGPLPHFYLMTDDERFVNPLVDLPRWILKLPIGAAIVLRHRDSAQLEMLARSLVPLAHQRKVKVLLAGDVRLALKLHCDGIHLSQAAARRGPLRIHALPPGFIITAAAHDDRSVQRAALMGAHGVMLSPVFATASHPDSNPLGLLRFMVISGRSARPIVALGGITAGDVKRLALGPTIGVAAIGAWQA